MSAEPVRVPAEWQPSLTCFCPACKLHINLLRVSVEPGSIRETELTVGGAAEGELVTVRCPNCQATVVVTGVRPGRSFRLSQLVGEGRVESPA